MSTSADISRLLRLHAEYMYLCV